MELIFEYRGDEWPEDDGVHEGLTIDPNISVGSYGLLPTASLLIPSGSGRKAIACAAPVPVGEDVAGFFYTQLPSYVSSEIEIFRVVGSNGVLLSISLSESSPGVGQFTLKDSTGTPLDTSADSFTLGEVYRLDFTAWRVGGSGSRRIAITSRAWNDTTELWYPDAFTLPAFPDEAISTIEFGRLNATGDSDSFGFDDLAFVRAEVYDPDAWPTDPGSAYEFGWSSPGSGAFHYGTADDLYYLVGDGITLVDGGLTPDFSDGVFVVEPDLGGEGYLTPNLVVSNVDDGLALQLYFLKVGVSDSNREFVRFSNGPNQDLVSFAFLGGELAGLASVSVGSVETVSDTNTPIEDEVWYRLELQLDPPNSRVRCGIFESGSTTPMWDSGWVIDSSLSVGASGAMIGRFSELDMGSVAFDEVGMSSFSEFSSGGSGDWLPPSPFEPGPPGSPPSPGGTPINPFGPTPGSDGLMPGYLTQGLYLYSGSDLMYVGYQYPLIPDNLPSGLTFHPEPQAITMHPAAQDTRYHAYILAGSELDWLTVNYDDYQFWESWTPQEGTP